MFDAMTKKELRDAARWMPVGLTLFLILIGYVLKWTGFKTGSSGELFSGTMFMSAVFGLFLSLVTFLPDQRDASRAFLLHRAMSIRKIYIHRVSIGLLVYFATSLLPLGLVAIYTLVTSPLSAPLSPRQVVPAMVAVLYCSAFYFAGIIVACRPVRWFGSRTVPILGAIGVAMCGCAITSSLPMDEIYVTVLIMLLFFSIGVVGLFLLARSSWFAFAKMPANISPAQDVITASSFDATLLFSYGLAISIVAIFFVSSWQFIPEESVTVDFSEDGTPWLITSKNFVRPPGKARTSIIEMKDSDAKSTSSTIDAIDNKYRVPAHFSQPQNNHQLWDVASVDLTGYSSRNAAALIRLFYHPSGYLLLYEIEGRERLNFIGTISLDHFSNTTGWVGTPFQSRPIVISNYAWYTQYASSTLVQTIEEDMEYNSANFITLINVQGVFRIDLEQQKIRTIIEKRIDAYSVLNRNANTKGTRLALKTDREVSVYDLPTPQKATEAKEDLKEESYVPVSVGSFSVAEFLQDMSYAQIHFKSPVDWTIVEPNFQPSRTEYQVARSKDSVVSTFMFQTPDEIIKKTNPENESFQIAVIFSAFPPLFMWGWTIIAMIYDIEFKTQLALLVVTIQCIVSVLLTATASRYRGLSTRQCWRWGLVGIGVGLATPLAILSLYPKLVRIPCSSCGRKRRVELDTCEHCQGSWELPAPVGIEIVSIPPMLEMAGVSSPSV